MPSTTSNERTRPVPALGGAALLFAASAIAACSSSSAGADPAGGSPADDAGSEVVTDAPDGDVPGTDATVTAFDAKPVYFTGTDDQRNVDADVDFPAVGTYEQITLHLALECPSAGCDAWDRFGSLGVRPDPAKDDVIELARFITPYGVGGAWDYDVTDLRPLLSGKLHLRGFIDTWVGPGSAYGGGWLLTARFEMKGGTPSRVPVAVVPVWTLTSAVYGDPAKPIAGSIPPQTIARPAGASSFGLRAFVTGHGQGNADNCAEFCAKEHTLTVGGQPQSQTIWRDDCAQTAVPGQQGNVSPPRTGWCPGADVKPWILDVTSGVTSATTTIAYGVETFDNTCRPDAPTCTGCALGTSCAYDDSAHTEPHWSVSALFIGYR